MPVVFGHADILSSRPPTMPVVFGQSDAPRTNRFPTIVLFAWSDVRYPYPDRVGQPHPPAYVAPLTHMARVGVRELRQQASALLRRVAAGEVGKKPSRRPVAKQRARSVRWFGLA